MSTTAITCPLLVLNTLSNNLVDAGGGVANGIVATTPTDGWVISPPAGTEFANNRLILRLFQDSSGTETFTVVAGDRYPAQRADLGNMTLSVGGSESRFVAIETSRFLQNDGTILITATDTGATLTALMLPISG